MGSVAAAIGIVLVLSATPTSAQEPDDGLRVESASVYRVRPDDGVVDVVVDYVLTNEIPSRNEGYYVRSFFFTEYFLIIPETATDIRAVRANGRVLNLRQNDDVEEATKLEEFGLVRWVVDLGGNLNFRATREFTISYTIPDGPPREPDAWARVNSAYVAVTPIADGDPGLSSVRVEMPRSFEPDSLGDPMGIRVESDDLVFEALAIEDPLDWFAVVFGTRDSGLAHSTVSIDGSGDDFSLASWPGDVEWETFVSDGITEGVPLLATAIGVDWPVEGTLEVIETVAPSLIGYAGVYYEPDGYGPGATIEVGEDLDLSTLVHELSHAWFNGDFSEMRWLTEGLAETMSLHLVDELDPGSADPFVEVRRTNRVALPLIEWTSSDLVEGDDPREEYGYSASYQVVSAIAEEIGFEEMTSVLGLLWRADNPYEPSLSDPGDELVDWRDALDAFEVFGGSTKVTGLFEEWVLDPETAAELGPREEARSAFRRLMDRRASWSIPEVVASLMADWRFEEATGLMEEIGSILDRAEEIEANAATRGLSVPKGPRIAFEGVTRPDHAFDRVVETLGKQETALAAVMAAHDRAGDPTGFLDRIGLYGTDVDADLELVDEAYETTRYELAIARADDVVALLDDAAGVGTLRLEIGGGSLAALLALVGLTFWMLRRRKRTQAEAGEVAVGTDPVAG